MLGMIRSALRPVSLVASGFAAHIAQRLWFTPPPHRTSERARIVLREAHHFRVSWEGVSIACWRWGQGPAVHLIHGWGGNAGDLSRLVSPLVERGFSVVAFDAPGHGL
jgi:alpha-beta hydrolase superfamily lysophospholipase